jgi:hypothetical protein
MASYTDDQILDAVRYHLETDSSYRSQLVTAIERKNESWVRKLVRFVVGAAVEIGRAVIAVITGWVLPRPSAW